MLTDKGRAVFLYIIPLFYCSLSVCCYICRYTAEDITNETLSSSETVITLHVENPEIILVEDTLAKSTNALILDVSNTPVLQDNFLNVSSDSMWNPVV